VVLRARGFAAKRRSTVGFTIASLRAVVDFILAIGISTTIVCTVPLE
jgi:hypothetical protein